MLNHEQFVGRVGRRRTWQRQAVVAAWFASGAALIAAIGGLASGMVAVVALIAAMAGAAAVRSVDRHRVADEIDQQLALPQTLGTAMRCGGGPGGVVASAANSAIEGRRVAEFTMPLGRLVALTAVPVAVAGLLTGLSVLLGSGSDGASTEDHVAFAGAGDVIGAIATDDIPSQVPPARDLSDHGATVADAAQPESSRPAAVTSAARDASTGDGSADGRKATGAANSSGKAIAANLEIDPDPAQSVEREDEATAPPGDGPVVVAAPEASASGGGQVDVERGDVPPPAPQRVASDRAGSGTDRDRRIAPAYRELVRAFFGEPSPSSH